MHQTLSRTLCLYDVQLVTGPPCAMWQRLCVLWASLPPPSSSPAAALRPLEPFSADLQPQRGVIVSVSCKTAPFFVCESLSDPAALSSMAKSRENTAPCDPAPLFYWLQNASRIMNSQQLVRNRDRIVARVRVQRSTHPKMAAGGEEVARHVPITLTHVLYEEGTAPTDSSIAYPAILSCIPAKFLRSLVSQFVSFFLQGIWSGLCWPGSVYYQYSSS